MNWNRNGLSIRSFAYYFLLFTIFKNQTTLCYLIFVFNSLLLSFRKNFKIGSKIKKKKILYGQIAIGVENKNYSFKDLNLWCEIQYKKKLERTFWFVKFYEQKLKLSAKDRMITESLLGRNIPCENRLFFETETKVPFKREF